MAEPTSGGGYEIRNEDPEFVRNFFQEGKAYLQAYGWFLLFACIGAWWIWSTWIKPKVRRVQQQMEAAVEKKTDLNEFVSKEEAMIAARMRLQEQYAIAAQKRAEEAAKQEEAKRQAQIDEWEKHQKGQGYHSKFRPTEEKPVTKVNSKEKSKPKSLLRGDDYNPLMGSGGSGAFRPRKCGPSSGG